MGALRTPREAWIEQGLRALATGGPDAVRIEVLAKQLGVTKGGFYGYFTNRDALLEAMLQTWEHRAIDEVLEQIEREGGDALTKVRRAGQLTFSVDRVLPVDLAVREWARRDASVAERLRRVDNRRIELSRELFRTYSQDPLDVEAYCLVAFTTALSARMIAADHDGYSRDEVIVRAVELFLTPDSRRTAAKEPRQGVGSDS